MRTVRPVVTLFLAALLLGGCAAAAPKSSGNFQGAEHDVAAVIDDLGARARKGDADGICTRVLSADLAARLKAGAAGCQDEVKHALGDADDYDLDVRDVTVSGTQATAQVRQGSRIATYRLARQGADWRVTSFG